jgi:PhzF family phenazine biosynthesis protein
MRVPIYQVDAFATRVFTGNPAAVVLLSEFPEDAVLQRVAAENNLAETAFVVRDGDDYQLRWFTPTVEVPLCGHATLASAWVVTECLDAGRTKVVFHTKSGDLIVNRTGDDFVMDFPVRTNTSVAEPQGLALALGAKPLEVFHDGFNFVAVLDSAKTVRDLTPNIGAIRAFKDVAGVIVTAAGDDGYDCVSRYFAPQKGIDEDPVTGGAHCALTPFWTNRLGKPEIHAYQASSRGGAMRCRIKGDRVELEGTCVFYMAGEAEIG